MSIKDFLTDKDLSAIKQQALAKFVETAKEVRESEEAFHVRMQIDAALDYLASEGYLILVMRSGDIIYKVGE